MDKLVGRFHVLTDYHFQQTYSHSEIARLAIDGGADTIQFRQKSGGVQHILLEAVRTADVCRRRAVTVLVNDRVDVALATGAQGVHLGQTDMPVRTARRILGPDALIGGTATTLEQALSVESEGADYVGFGPVFQTTSKRNPASVKGLALLETVCSKVTIPTIAIAGITAARVRSVMESGAYGVAVMTAISLSDNPTQTAKEIREAIDDAVDLSPVVSRPNGRA